MSQKRTFEGESQNGDIQEAIGTALDRLGREIGADGVCDALAQWTLGEISGEYGGIAGFRSVTVRISASRSPEWQS